MYSLKLHNVQQLSLVDKAARMEMWLRFQEKIDNDIWINNVWFSDEAHFYLNGNVNSQNCKTCWSSEPPDEFNERPLHSTKRTSWCAKSAPRTIGPLWFEEHVTTVNYTGTIPKDIRLLLCFVSRLSF